MLLINENVALLRSNGSPRLPVANVVFPRKSRIVEKQVEKQRATGVRRVALIIETSGSYGRGLLQGIARFNREHGGWATYFRPRGLGDPLPAWLNKWTGDGMLIRADTADTLEWARRANIPVVTLRSTLAKLPFPNVSIDDRQVAKLAFDHLRERGLRNLAFCGRTRGLNPALDVRYEQFQSLAERDGCASFAYEAPDGMRTDWFAEQERLTDWIQSLPKPVGIMACNDERGHQVLEACRCAGVTVPDDVAVIGVDNDQAICDLSIPALSSVDVNAEGIGYEAASLLDRLMDGQKPSERVMKLAPRGVMTRRSTDVVASDDDEVARALRFIRENACRGLQVAGVLTHMAMSRASLQQRLKQAAGRTIHQEIQRVRLARAKDLLAMSDMTIKQVARESGFASVQYMTRVFHAITSETPARYRGRRSKGNGSGAGARFTKPADLQHPSSLES